MANQFKNIAKKVLETSPIPLTYNEIWEEAVKKGLEKTLKGSGKTPWQTLGAQLFVDVRDNINTEFIKVGSRPARFFLKERSSEINNQVLKKIDAIPEKSKVNHNYSERELHPVISYYLYSNLNFNRGRRILSKTIYHEKSKKGGYNEWIFPDMVGFFIPLEEWNNEIVELNRISDNNILRLFSFEVKKVINRGNHRESFFQAVSNSSWAHEGYLVASEIKDDEDLLAELARLTQSFAIGIIKLDLDDIDSSSILFPATPKKSLDWETMNKLSETNPDFKKFIEDIKIDLESKRIHNSEYDKIEDDVEKYIKKMKK
ncbi:MAG TPA: HTH domain-containing protein [Ignavibacteria bacterium]